MRTRAASRQTRRAPISWKRLLHTVAAHLRRAAPPLPNTSCASASARAQTRVALRSAEETCCWQLFSRSSSSSTLAWAATRASSRMAFSFSTASARNLCRRASSNWTVVAEAIAAIFRRSAGRGTSTDVRRALSTNASTSSSFCHSSSSRLSLALHFFNEGAKVDSRPMTLVCSMIRPGLPGTGGDSLS